MKKAITTFEEIKDITEELATHYGAILVAKNEEDKRISIFEKDCMKTHWDWMVIPGGDYFLPGCFGLFNSAKEAVEDELNIQGSNLFVFDTRHEAIVWGTEIFNEWDKEMKR